MGRRLFSVAVLLGAFAATSSIAAAQPIEVAPQQVKASKNTAIKFAVGRIEGDYAMTAQGGGLTFFKRVGPSKVLLRLQVRGDVVEVEASSNGAARFARNGKDIRFHMRDADESRVLKLQRLASGSRALAAFEAMIATTEASQTPESRSLSTSYALVQAVRGSGDAGRSLASRLNAPLSGARRASAMRSAEEPQACWAEYSATMNTYLTQFSTCVLDYGWIPGMPAVCAFEFSVKAELAWFWVIGCSGGIPV